MVDPDGGGTQQGAYASLIAELGRAQKPGRAVPPYLRYINRPIGRRFAALAHMAGLTPNAVTWMSLAVSTAGLVVLATVGPSIISTVLVPFLLAMGFALDSADGQLARLQRSGSPAGEWLDHVVDAARTPSLHLAVLIYFMRWEPQTWMLALPMIFLVVTSTRFFSQILGEQLRRRHAIAEPAQGTDAQATRREWMRLPSDTGVINLSFVLVAWPRVFATVYAILCGANILLAAASFRRRHHELAALQGSGPS